MTTPFPLSHNPLRIQACSNKISGSIARALSKMRAPVGAYLSKLINLKSYDDFALLPFPSDISVTFGTELTKLIVNSYILGASSPRKVKEAASRFAAARGSSPEDYVAFSWDLASVKAVDAFSSDAFAIAQTMSAELKLNLQAEAKAAFANGVPFSQFRDSLHLAGFDTGNPYHLRTNYDSAANLAYAAGHWDQIQNLKNVFKYLRYVTLGNESVCDICGPLNGLIYAVDDPFWDTWAPINHWNCHCSVEQLTADEAADDPKLNRSTSNLPNPQAGFTGNPAVSNHIPDEPRTSDPILTNAHELNLPEPHEYPHWGLDMQINTASMSRPDLLNLYESKIIQFANPYPAPDGKSYLIAPTKNVLNKFNNENQYSLQDLRKRFSYLDYLPGIIKDPDEIWNRNVKGLWRPHFIKFLDKNLVLIFEASEGHYDFFNILVVTKIDKIRNGILLYNRSLP